MQSVNGAQFLNITPLSFSFARFAASLSLASVIVMVPLTCMYALLWLYKFDLITEVLILIWLLLSYVLPDSSFILF